MNLDIQERVYKELTDVYDTDSNVSDLEMIGKLVYMEMVIKETMRLIPVGPFLARECQAETEICNYTYAWIYVCKLPIHFLHFSQL